LQRTILNKNAINLESLVGKMITSLNVVDGHKTLNITWSDGNKGKVTAKYLRENAQDAVSKRAWFDGKENPVSEHIKITDVSVLGHSSLNITFSDGHVKAIYPFSYLKELSTNNDNKLTLSDSGTSHSDF
jgi:prepilin-type processing-associated H-X9-DG protein